MQQRKYSTTLAKARVVVEQSFGLWKGRWRHLQNLAVDVDAVPCLILAVCILHNICMTEEEEEFEDMELDGEGANGEEEGEEEVEQFHPDQVGGAALVQHLTAVIAALPPPPPLPANN